MKDIWLIFSSIFAAGVVSLLLELSLLREFTYIFGSTAASNALIISIFLVGLAVGAYLGTWGTFTVKDETDARRKFALIQLLNIIFVVIFCLSKKYFVYHSPYPNLVRLYFMASVLAPSLLSGMGYAISVKIMHWRGEKFITYIYAFSTLGSVVGGLAHGIMLVPLWGMRSTYIAAVIFASLALYLMYSLMNLAHKALLALLVSVAVGLIHFNVSELLFPSKDILFSKDSEFGIVEVWRLNHEKAGYLNLRIGGRDPELKRIMNPGGIVLLLGDGLSWNTTKRCFRYAYKNINPQTEHALRLNLFYLTDQPISEPAASDYALVQDGMVPGGLIYSDEKVFLLSRSEFQ